LKVEGASLSWNNFHFLTKERPLMKKSTKERKGKLTERSDARAFNLASFECERRSARLFLEFVGMGV
jgi:hypothetical protein